MRMSDWSSDVCSSDLHGGVITAFYLIAMGWAPPDRVAQATGTLVGLAGGIGGVLATTPLVLALETVGIEGTFLALAALTAAVMVAILLLVRDGPPRAAGHPGQRETLMQSVRGMFEVMRMPELRRIFVMGDRKSPRLNSSHNCAPRMPS